MSKRKAIICDIDNCLLNTIQTTNLQEFFMCIHDYTINEWCESLLNAMSKQYKIIFITARGQQWEYATRIDLDLICNFKYMLCMRVLGDLREDFEVKKDYVLELQKQYEIVCAIDDNINNCNMYKSLNIPVLHVL